MAVRLPILYKEMNKSKLKILAIETSCDETAASLILSGKVKTNIVASQIKLHKKYGGVYPEVASRAHAEKIIEVIGTALGKDLPDIIAVTVGPGLIGSLLVGVAAARSLALIWGKKICPVNHLEGHIYSNWIEGPAPKFPALVLIVSGGHTSLVLMKGHGKYRVIGETLDDAAGEAFDKVARLLDMDYPGGPAISRAARAGNPEAFDLPRAMLDRDDFNFSFSGLKTAVLRITKEKNNNQKFVSDTSSSFQKIVVDILVEKTIRAARKYDISSVLLCGGVAANQSLRDTMSTRIKKLSSKILFKVPKPEYCTDNAAKIGIAAFYNLNLYDWQNVRADANLKL